MHKFLIVFGTRPEAIKMAPLVKLFAAASMSFETKICVTAQHRGMLDQVLEFFELKADYDLNLMKPDQSLYSITAEVIIGLKDILDDFNPDYVFVHGDTTTSAAAALAAFYHRANVVHIEAGLRTYSKWSPFPEEINRQLTSKIADLHFAPTILAKKNLLSEGTSPEAIKVVGNTVIDALLYARQKLSSYSSAELDVVKSTVAFDKKVILVTGHRRENFGQGFINICKALRKISEREDVQIIYPVHLNPNVKRTVFEYLSDIDNVSLIEPLSYPSFVWLMNTSYLILTDSGGVQEEAPSLGKPVLVMRDTSERPEAVECGTVKLVGTDTEKIVREVFCLLDDSVLYSKFSEQKNPYGDGTACAQILDELKKLV